MIILGFFVEIWLIKQDCFCILLMKTVTYDIIGILTALHK